MSTQQRALVTPYIDFWLVGGFSLLFLATCVLTTYLAKVDMNTFIPVWAFWLAFVINYPHFAHSYQLFYEDFHLRLKDQTVAFKDKIRPAISGIVVPILLIAYFYWSYVTHDLVMLGNAVRVMYFFVGWHYVKQGYGILITLSVFKRVFYTPLTKAILTLNVYAVWAYAWIRSNASVARFIYYDVPNYSMEMPQWLIQGAAIFMIITSVIALGAILKTWLVDKKGICINGLVGYICSSYIWVVLPSINKSFFVFVAFFHSLQYMPFVYKFKSRELRHKIVDGGNHDDKGRLYAYWPLALFTLIGIVLGASFMHIIPKQIDKLSRIPDFTQNFFLVSFLVFINIHHYFIDSAFWRRGNKRVQEYLFSA